MTGRSPPCRSRGLRRWARDASRWKTLPHRPAGGDRKNAGPNAGLVERVLSARGLEVADERVRFRVGHRADVDMRREPRIRVARHRLLGLRGDLLGQGASRHRQLDVDDDVMGTAGQVVCIATGGIAGVVASKRGGDAADNGGGRGVGCWNDGDVGDHSQLRHGTTQSGVYDVIQTFQHGVLNDRRLLYCKRVGRARGERNGNGRCGPGRMDRTARRIGCERGHVGRMPTVSAVRVCVGGYGRSGRETDVIGVRMRNGRARRFSSASGRAPSSDRLR